MSAALPPPATAAGRAGLVALLRRPQAALVVVDFDGTLAPIVTRPQDARALPGTAALLDRLARRAAGVAVLTGRGAAEAARLAGLGPGSQVEVVGHYGWQRWVAGRLESPPPHPGVAAARAALPGLLAGAEAGVQVEDKGLSLVVHTRQAGDPQGELERLRPALADLAARAGLELLGGRLVWELRPGGTDKGAALRALAERHPRARALLLAGDDVGDLPAFQAAAALRGRGVAALLVAVDGEGAPAELAAAADLSLAGPAALTGLLAGLAAAWRV